MFAVPTEGEVPAAKVTLEVAAIRNEQGQEIGLSGKTGLALFPHLHFLVWTNRDGQWKQVPTRFNTTKGDRYLKPFRFFKKPESEKEYFSTR